MTASCVRLVRWTPVLALALLWPLGCATRPPRVEAPDFALEGLPHYPTSVRGNAVVLVAMLDTYWHPPRRRWFRRSGPSDWLALPAKSFEAATLMAVSERDWWLYLGEGTRDHLLDRLKAGAPVIVFLQDDPLDRATWQAGLLAGVDEQGDTWLLYGLDIEPVLLSDSRFMRLWSQAGSEWATLLPPDRASWSLTPSELYSRGRWYMEAESYQLARDDFERALAEKPGAARLYIELADAHWWMGEPALAEPLYRAALILMPDAARALNNLAHLLLHEEGETIDEALSLARRATMLDPQNPRLWNTLGLAYAEAGDWREAARALQRARVRAMDEQVAIQTEIALNLVRIYHEGGQGHLARQTLNDALRLDPDLEVPSTLDIYRRRMP